MTTGQKAPAVSVPTEDKFNGKPVLVLPNPEDNSKPGITLGTRKLQAVLSNLPAVNAFVAKHAKPASVAEKEKELVAERERVARLEALVKSLGGDVLAAK